ncbi:MAG: tRNA delta(2)-isopentenylpyrophosphate transferase [Candidatus Woesebacteria bacterium GW2011_GWB1_43_14]|uniref:tRNA dimethylallyltransferase n=1 Tax=Candidatus Woesebacteria bacterium GW2011_GWB1_43_14 TaxID=1618578 RepID=A0A0G1DHM2_9BACT|nr:MAG: tRNA delta(2)-isopentenylpyrophosphate transferase [Candidatus Woesebacteria bacterium GW2011_GWA1_39_11b]KKS78055.1 MAG: tRNA delta(2)-isopentenylpyrophosphate transferase [Candidatus Woesebacteria bacterium GW2011_GWC1_42_9]KKS97365.1 MAG: tRNA delta(2)-isopentenylpyrophosphate transferase [Candidatus Woesebacteria bacterium GW2011_GWB1_43_14]
MIINKLLVICGPTATGKTKLAARLAKKLNGEIISADSRQVYQGFDIGTGKDFDLLKEMKFWGYDLVGSREEYSVAQYIKFARKTVENICARGKLPIIIGGTGLYIKGLIDGIETSRIKKNLNLRVTLRDKSAAELFDILESVDIAKARSLNESDKRNPRRLIRAIEISKSNLDLRLSNTELTKTNYDLLMIGLGASKGDLNENIKERVIKRVDAGIKEEISGLLKSGVSWDDQSMSSLGYRQWKPYFEGKVGQKEVIDNWIRAERQYAKRQMTWFKRDKRIRWFDVHENSFEKHVEDLVQKWYSVK